jgi:hypothetical protein
MIEKRKALAIGGPLDGKMVEFEGTYIRAVVQIPLPERTMIGLDPPPVACSVGWFNYEIKKVRFGDRLDYFAIPEFADVSTIIASLIDAYVNR